MTPEEEMVRALQNAHTGEDLECHCWHGAELLKAYAQLAITASSALCLMNAAGDDATTKIARQLRKDLKVLDTARKKWSE